jgi:hypothetical protein
MSVFLINKHNLGDIDDVVKARKNLGIFSVYDPNNVNITGGSIGVDKFCLFPPHGCNVENYYMMSDSNGCGSWRERTLDDLHSEILISTFSNDVPYLTREFVENSFLQSASNLSDLSDTMASVSNLGLAFLLGPNRTIQSKIYKEFNNLIMDNQIITEDFEIRGNLIYPQANLPVNNIISFDRSFKMVSFEIMNDKEQIFNNNVILYGTKKPVSANLLKDVYSNINLRVNSLNNTIDSLVTGSFYTRKDLNLSDVNSSERARSNLGFGSYIIDNSTLKVGDLYALNSFTLSEFDLGVDRLEGTVLTSDDYGRGTWQKLPIATFSNYGIVGISMDFLNDTVETYDQVVPTVNALREYFNNSENGRLTQLDNQITTIRNGFLNINNRFSEYRDLAPAHRNTLLDNLNIQTNNIQNFPTVISAFDDDVGYLKTENNLSELVGLELHIVQSNLAFSAVAVSGEYSDLLNIPSSFSDYVLRASNLLDIDSVEARSNLGLGNFATMDSGDVLIEGGILRSINSIQTDEFIFTSNMPNYNTLSNIIFLKANDVAGTAVWAPLPYASFNQVGILKLVTDYWDQHSDDSTYSSTLVHSNLYELNSNFNAFRTLINEKLDESDLEIDGDLIVGGNIRGNPHTVRIDDNLSVSGTLTIESLSNENSLLYIDGQGAVNQSMKVKQNSGTSCGLTFEPDGDTDFKFRIIVEGTKFIIAKQNAIGSSNNFITKHIFR